MNLVLYSLFGLLLGVLVNRAADNLPRAQRISLLHAPHCPFCDTPRGISQFGVLSLLLGRARCTQCNAPLSPRVPIVELVSAAAFGFLYARFGPTAQLLAASVFTLLLLTILVIDAEHRLVLNVVVLPATAIAILLSPWTFPAFEAWRAVLVSIAGAAAGYFVVLAIYWLGGLVGMALARARGQTLNEIPFGLGDVKLAGFVGAVVGFVWVFPMLFLTVLLGGVGAVAVLAYHAIVNRRYAAMAVMPYGPFFVLAAWYFLVR